MLKRGMSWTDNGETRVIDTITQKVIVHTTTDRDCVGMKPTVITEPHNPIVEVK